MREVSVWSLPRIAGDRFFCGVVFIFSFWQEMAMMPNTALEPTAATLGIFYHLGILLSPALASPPTLGRGCG